MKSTIYLYGLVAGDLADMRYEDALEAKIRGARDVMDFCTRKAHHVLGKNQKLYDSYMDRYLAAEKAVDFNKRLIEEMR